ncbi:unnamed protein product [Caenorhabditis brenneri]
MGLLYSKPLEIFNLDFSTEWSPTPKNLRLFRLPLLALLEVFKSLDPIELFILSQCSRKTANCIHIVGSKNWKLSVDVGHKHILINNHYRLIIIESFRNHNWEYDNNLKTIFLKYQVSKESELELRKVLAWVQAVFKCPVPTFKHTHWIPQSDQCWFSVLKHISQNQIQPLESLVLRESFKKEDLKWILRNVRVSGKMNIYSTRDNRFTTDFQPTCEQITIHSRVRVNLMKFKSCKYIKLTYSGVTMRDLDEFMKEWMTGSFPNLQYLSIKKGRINWIDSILGFKRFEMRQLDVTRRLVIDENLWVDCTGGRDIEAVNGTKATMQMDRETNSFELFVWKE